MPVILTSIDRYGSLMVSEYTPTPGKKDHWHCELLAERMKSELFEPPINMLFVDARGEVARRVRRARRAANTALITNKAAGRDVCPRNELTATAQQAPELGPLSLCFGRSVALNCSRFGLQMTPERTSTLD